MDQRDFADVLERAWERRSEWENMGILAHGKIVRLGDFESSKDLFELLDAMVSVVSKAQNENKL